MVIVTTGEDENVYLSVLYKFYQIKSSFKGSNLIKITNGDDYEQDFDCSQNNEVSLTINNDIDLEEKKMHRKLAGLFWWFLL